MLAQMTGVAAAVGSHPAWSGGHGPWGGGGPGWWLVFPILFWVIALSIIGNVIYRRSPARSSRAAAERILAERYARGEISEDELRQRRGVLRGKS